MLLENKKQLSLAIIDALNGIFGARFLTHIAGTKKSKGGTGVLMAPRKILRKVMQCFRENHKLYSSDYDVSEQVANDAQQICQWVLKKWSSGSLRPTIETSLVGVPILSCSDSTGVAAIASANSKKVEIVGMSNVLSRGGMDTSGLCERPPAVVGFGDNSTLSGSTSAATESTNDFWNDLGSQLVEADPNQWQLESMQDDDESTIATKNTQKIEIVGMTDVLGPLEACLDKRASTISETHPSGHAVGGDQSSIAASMPPDDADSTLDAWSELGFDQRQLAVDPILREPVSVQKEQKGVSKVEIVGMDDMLQPLRDTLDEEVPPDNASVGDGSTIVTGSRLGDHDSVAGASNDLDSNRAVRWHPRSIIISDPASRRAKVEIVGMRNLLRRHRRDRKGIEKPPGVVSSGGGSSIAGSRLSDKNVDFDVQSLHGDPLLSRPEVLEDEQEALSMILGEP